MGIKILEILQSFVDNINESNSNLEKKQTIQKWLESENREIIIKCLDYIFSYKHKFYVTSKNIIKNSNLIAPTEQVENLSCFDVLDILRTRQMTGHDALALVNGFIRVNPQHEDLILKVIDRKLNCRIDAKTINAVEDIIPTFDVALGEKFEDKHFDYENDNWFISKKLDGIRCLAFVTAEGTTFYSRQGEEHLTIGKLSPILSSITELHGMVIDGELALINEDDSDDFQGLMKEIRRKDHTIDNIRFNMFDCLTLEEFESKTSKSTFSERYSRLTQIETEFMKTPHLRIVEQLIANKESFDVMVQKSLDNNWEGLILRKDDVYKGKRSKDLLKYKKFEDAEYVVNSVNIGKKPMLINGVMQEVDCLASINIEHKGNIVQVGSGFNDQQRIDFYNDNSLIIGKTIKVKYFEETQDQNGNYSLRFPILLTIYENGRFD